MSRAELTEDQRKAYDFAAEVAKQIITLSTAIITVSVALSGSTLEDGPSSYIIASWAFFLLAILCGISTLGALTSNMANSEPDIYKSNVRIPAISQTLCFTTAIIMAAIVGYQLMNKPSKKDKSDKSEKIIIENKFSIDKTSIDTIIYKH
jgi:hypothetical protein